MCLVPVKEVERGSGVRFSGETGVTVTSSRSRGGLLSRPSRRTVINDVHRSGQEPDTERDTSATEVKGVLEYKVSEVQNDIVTGRSVVLRHDL